MGLIFYEVQISDLRDYLSLKVFNELQLVEKLWSGDNYPIMLYHVFI